MAIAGLKVYPNPAGNNLTVSFTAMQAGHMAITLYSISGKKVKTVDYGMLSPSTQKLMVPLKGIAPGVYFLRMQVGNKVLTKKVVKL